MLRPRFVQARGNTLKDLCTDVDNKDRQEGPVEADRKPGPEKIIAHDYQQDQRARYDEAVIHLSGRHPLPRPGVLSTVLKVP